MNTGHHLITPERRSEDVDATSRPQALDELDDRLAGRIFSY